MIHYTPNFHYAYRHVPCNKVEIIKTDKDNCLTNLINSTKKDNK